LQTNVLDWEDQVALFKLAIARFGSVDIVVGIHLDIFVCQAYLHQVVNAGVLEKAGNFETIKLVDGLPTKPELKTIEINLIAAIYSAYVMFNTFVAFHVFPRQLHTLLFIIYEEIKLTIPSKRSS
jgi:hypothetical protein